MSGHADGGWRVVGFGGGGPCQYHQMTHGGGGQK